MHRARGCERKRARLSTQLQLACLGASAATIHAADTLVEA